MFQTCANKRSLQDIHLFESLHIQYNYIDILLQTNTRSQMIQEKIQENIKKKQKRKQLHYMLKRIIN